MALVTKTFSDIITFSRPSGATWFNSAGVLQGVDFSVTSNTIGTGSKTFTLTATAGVNRYWATGDTVLISQQSNSADNMTGTVTSYDATTQALVVDVTSTGGSGTIASWRIGSTMPRFDYNPSTLAARGLLIEEARTNSIRNNTMQGAVAGTPGTLPTNWISGASGVGITQEIIGTGTENGIAYIDFRFNGTATANNFVVSFETSNQISASSGQSWAGSWFVKVISAPAPFISYTSRIRLNDAGFAGVGQIDTVFTPTSTLTRYTSAGTIAVATTAFVQPQIRFGMTIGGAYDVTVRIGLPQLELGAFATSVIPTTNALALGVTRSADAASVNTLSPWFNATEGTLYAEAVGVANISGATRRFAEIGNGTINERFIFGYSTTTNTRFLVQDGGVNQADVQVLTGVLAGSLVKMAAAYAGNDFQQASNGTLGTAGTSGALPTVTAMYLGNDYSAAAATTLNGYLRRITYYPRRLSNAELQTITA